jgi:hypothetical protein
VFGPDILNKTRQSVSHVIIGDSVIYDELDILVLLFLPIPPLHFIRVPPLMPILHSLHLLILQTHRRVRIEIKGVHLLSHGTPGMLPTAHPEHLVLRQHHVGALLS